MVRVLKNHSKFVQETRIGAHFKAPDVDVTAMVTWIACFCDNGNSLINITTTISGFFQVSEVIVAELES